MKAAEANQPSYEQTQRRSDREGSGEPMAARDEADDAWRGCTAKQVGTERNKSKNSRSGLRSYNVLGRC